MNDIPAGPVQSVAAPPATPSSTGNGVADGDTSSSFNSLLEAMVGRGTPSTNDLGIGSIAGSSERASDPGPSGRDGKDASTSVADAILAAPLLALPAGQLVPAGAVSAAQETAPISGVSAIGPIATGAIAKDGSPIPTGALAKDGSPAPTGALAKDGSPIPTLAPSALGISGFSTGGAVSGLAEGKAGPTAPLISSIPGTASSPIAIDPNGTGATNQMAQATDGKAKIPEQAPSGTSGQDPSDISSGTIITNPTGTSIAASTDATPLQPGAPVRPVPGVREVPGDPVASVPGTRPQGQAAGDGKSPGGLSATAAYRQARATVIGFDADHASAGSGDNGGTQPQGSSGRPGQGGNGPVHFSSAPAFATNGVAPSTGAAGTEASPSAANLVDQILRQAASLSVPRNSRLRLRLSPPSLGQVDLHLRLEKGQLSLDIVADSKLARDLIQASLPQLRQALSDQRIEVGQLSLSSSLMDGAGGRLDNFSNPNGLARDWSGAQRQPSQRQIPIDLDEIPQADIPGDRGSPVVAGSHLVDYRI